MTVVRVTLARCRTLIAPHVKIHAPRRNERAATRECRGQRQPVTVVRVDDVRLEGRDGPPQLPPRSGVERQLPCGAVHGCTIRGGAPGQLAGPPGEENLLDCARVPELAAQQPDLVLAAAPFATRVYLEHPHLDP